MCSQQSNHPIRAFRGFARGIRSRASRLGLVLALCALTAAVETSFAQRKTATVKGVVTDAATKQPLVGVTCIVEGTQRGTTTGVDGTFTLDLASGGAKTLSFSYIGYETREVVWNNQTELKIELSETAQAMDEVIVVGYGSQKKSDITGAVGSVAKDRIEKMVSTDIAQIMQGSVPGLNVMATTAGANPEGQSGLMLIRGRNSISASNDPLVVLDGIPYYGSISDINPSDIASIEVLKDASSAAIYGSRGSNGVILISTRQGTEGKVTIRYDGYYAIQTVANFPHIMNGEEYYNYKKGWTDDDDSDPDAFLNETERAVYADGSWKKWTWKDLLTRTGYSTRHNISASGGSKVLKYNVSLNYLRNKGTIINDQYQRAQLRVNLTSNLTKWLTYTTNTMLTWSNNSGATPKFVDVFNKSPLLRPFNEDGSINITPDASNEKRFNPLECLLYDDYNASYKLATNNSFKATLTKGLTYTLNTGIQFYDTEHNEYQGTNTGAMKSYNGWGKISDKKRFAYSLENILNYERKFGRHGLFFTFVYSFEENTNRTNELEGYDFPNDLLSYNGLAQAKQLTPYIEKTNTKLISQMFRANYEFDNRYLFTFTVRRDGYSGFGANNKWGVFPSVAVGWNIANEAFFGRATDVMNVLKLRFSWGRNGNQAISAFQTISTLGSSDYVNGSNLAPGYMPDKLGTPDLTWETTDAVNLGLDFAFLNSRITGEFNVYRNNTYDLLLERSISDVNGLDKIYQNIGKTRNEGIEVSLTSTNLRTKKFAWKTSFNIAFIRTQIREIYGDGRDDIDNKWFIGYPIKVNYDYYITGVWQLNEANLAAQYGAQPGYAKYDDRNGNGAYDADDRQVIGSPEPNVTWSLNNQFTYGPVDLIVYLYGAGGMVKYNPFYAKNILVKHNYWTPDNPTNDYWSVEDGYANQYIASKSVTPGKYEKASFWRIKDITLSYTLPETFLSKVGISQAKVYFSCKNPWTFTQYTGMDPELDEQRAKPVQREFLFGLNLSF